MTNRIAYFTKATTKTPATLTVTTLGERFTDGQTVTVAGKREARAYCVANGIKPWNF